VRKIGRNQPCPCGSGNKYKKCCLKNQNTAPDPRPPQDDSVDPIAGTVGAMTPYVLAKLFENSEQFAEMMRSDPARARLFWTPRRLADLDTDAILKKLSGLGIMTGPDDFRLLAETSTSAWAVSNVWQAKKSSGLSRYDDDFLGLAACELWKRYCPDVPSIEMLDDWMQEGYGFMMDGDAARACDRWAMVWGVIRPRLEPWMRTCEQASEVFSGTQSLFNWLQDFCLELHNAALGAPRYASDGVRFCNEIAAQFVDEDDLFRRNFRTDLGEFHFLAGCPNEGEEVLLGVIRDYPDRAAGYVRLAEILGHGCRPGDPPIDILRAQTLLDDAITRPVQDAQKYGLEGQLKDLRARNHTTDGAELPPGGS